MLRDALSDGELRPDGARFSVGFMMVEARSAINSA